MYTIILSENEMNLERFGKDVFHEEKSWNPGVVVMRRSA